MTQPSRPHMPVSPPAASPRKLPADGGTIRTADASTVEKDIFSATERLLQQKSLGDLTVADILAEAGISRRTFYRHFTSKHTVVSAMLAMCGVELVDVMVPWSRRGDRPVEEALRQAVVSAADVWGRHRAVLRASSETWHQDPEIGQQWVAMMDRFVADIRYQIDRERQEGSAPPGADSHKLALFLTWGAERLFYLAGFGLCGPGLEHDVVDSLITVWVGAVYKI